MFDSLCLSNSAEWAHKLLGPDVQSHLCFNGKGAWDAVIGHSPPTTPWFSFSRECKYTDLQAVMVLSSKYACLYYWDTGMGIY